VAHGWVLTGYSYKNVAGMLEWYAEGRVGRDKPNGNGNGGASGGRSTNEYTPTEDQKRRYREALGSRLMTA